ncbi:Acetyltransferase (GNAT) domain-containing protein [Micromonospora viridifaciens]|uniref:Acetyltransferase (GNAT) domain-containing protein n=1 Tax=Micromonospora viridifaciens TaxID=1881 RepID=A0A1C4ZR67_MICVI|nr:GNAT family N-acetyltransferase [Micromonospora viridifaciens]SCF35382.1 Acetyltransferase (GNAT) domain-containing protein [Micromonospora viridifaciens]
MALLIRPARPAEAADLTELALRSKGHWGYDNEFLARCRTELTLTPADVTVRQVTVAERAGRLVGLLVLAGAPPEMELDMLFVDPPAIGTGVGRVLFDHAVAAARAAGARTLWIDADPGAEPFYRHVGAVPAGTSVSPSTGRTLPRLRHDL